MKFLIAPNAMKGSLSAMNAASLIAKSLSELLPDPHCVLCPIADGGDGTLDCLIRATNGKIVTSRVRGPIASMEVAARWGVLGDDKTAVIEMAEAAGLRLLRPDQYDVMNATTAGVGDLIDEACKEGYEKIIIGLGGSATNDGGIGCCRALGVKFLDKEGDALEEGGKNLVRLSRIEDKRKEIRNKKITIVALSDVRNTLYGPEGAAYTFAGQKGATPEEIRKLDAGLRNYASIIERDLRVNVSEIPGSGAAGGLGAGLAAFCGAAITSGIEFVLDIVRFDKLVQECDCVITAEGKIDSQTLHGKGIEGVARRARQLNKPVHAFVGSIGGDANQLCRQLGLTSLHQISPGGISIEDSMKNAEKFLCGKIKEVFGVRR